MMQSEKGSATVPVALFGVSPNSWCSRFHSPTGASGRVLPVRRRDADGSGRDDRAPHQSTASLAKPFAGSLPAEERPELPARRLSACGYAQAGRQHACSPTPPCQRIKWRRNFRDHEVGSSQSGFKKVSRARRSWLVPVKLRACDKMRGRGRPRPIFESTLRSPFANCNSP